MPNCNAQLYQIIAWKLNDKQEPIGADNRIPWQISGKAGNNAVYDIEREIQNSGCLFLLIVTYPLDEMINFLFFELIQEVLFGKFYAWVSQFDDSQ